MKELLIGIGISSIAPMLLALVVKNKMLYKVCKRTGKTLSAILRTKLGRKLEGAIEQTIISAMSGFKDGLREDNLVQVAKKNIKEKKKIEIIKEVELLKKKSPL